MKLAICDDNKNQLHSIAQMLERYVTPEGEKVRYDLYGNALDLVQPEIFVRSMRIFRFCF